MTDKANQILKTIKNRDRQATLRRLRKPDLRNKVLDELNQSTLDTPSRVGGGGRSEDKFLREMNSLEDEFQQHIEAVGPKVTVY